MTRSDLRLQASLREEAERFAQAEGTTLNQFVNVAVAEKIAALRTGQFYHERAARADITKAFKILDRAGTAAPDPRDLLPPDWDEEAGRRR
jgi:hypothetical protein